jgi:hypothetical protein
LFKALQTASVRSFKSEGGLINKCIKNSGTVVRVGMGSTDKKSGFSPEYTVA